VKRKNGTKAAEMEGLGKRPVLGFQTGDLAEVALVASDENAIRRKDDGCDA
jgi:hypothetical protein